MLKGSCLCGGITFEYQGELTELAVCHCSMCRRAQGTAFATNAPVQADKLKILTGNDLLKPYYSSPGKKRVFCSNCGSPVYSQRDSMPEIVRLRAGTITEGKVRKPDYQIYCDSKVDWFVLDDGRPMYSENKE